MKRWLPLLLLLAFTQVSHADRQKFTVLLMVPPQFNKYENEVKSYLKRELREIKDVEIVDKGGDFFISVVPAPVVVVGKSTFVAVSYVIEYGDNIIHRVEVGSTSNLKEICQRVIAQFDGYVLEPHRK